MWTRRSRSSSSSRASGPSWGPTRSSRPDRGLGEAARSELARRRRRKRWSSSNRRSGTPGSSREEGSSNDSAGYDRLRSRAARLKPSASEGNGGRGFTILLTAGRRGDAVKPPAPTLDRKSAALNLLSDDQR